MSNNDDPIVVTIEQWTVHRAWRGDSVQRWTTVRNSSPIGQMFETRQEAVDFATRFRWTIVPGPDDAPELNLNAREVGMLLAGLRLLQEQQDRLPPMIADILDEGAPDGVPDTEIDALCEAINFGWVARRRRA